MTTVGSGKRGAAFTLIELLAVCVVIIVLAIIAIPFPYRGEREGYTVHCMNNLKQVGIGLYVWADTHTNQFPFQLSVTNGGSLELTSSGNPAAQFQMLSNCLTTNLAKVLICPSDTKKKPAPPGSLLTDSNISYFVSIDANPTQMRPVDLILAGDRHLAMGGKPVGSGLFILTSNAPMGWTKELLVGSPQPFGTLLFLDGHVERIRDDRLPQAVRRQPISANRLLMP